MSTPSEPHAGSGAPIVISASDHWRATESLVDGAARLAEAVVIALRSANRVTVSLRGVRGITSSFANVLFQRVAQEHGPSAIRDRLAFDTDSEAQLKVLERSREAAEQPQ